MFVYSLHIFYILLFMLTLMKAQKILYWISTVLLALFILPGLFFMNSEMAQEWMKHVGLASAPWLVQLVWFGAPLAILFILIPGVWRRLKEWSYLALGIIYVWAFWAHINIDWFIPMSFTPVVTFGVLLVSYLSWHKILKHNGQHI